MVSFPDRLVHAFQQHQQYYAGMSVAITIRNVPQETRDELAARAAQRGMSLQEFLRSTLMTIADSPTMEEIIEGVRERKAASDAHAEVEAILEAIAADRP